MSYRPSAQAQVIGAGTDYSLTNSMARIDFGTTDPEIVLPTAGTYLLIGIVDFFFNVVALSAGDVCQFKFRNSTDAVDVAGGTPVQTNPSATLPIHMTVTATAVLTVTASKTIQLWAANLTAARGVIRSDFTMISYLRLY